jgi:hypothetical protein
VPIHVRVWLGSGSNEPNSSVCGAPRAGAFGGDFGGARLAAGSLLARTCVGGPEPGSRIHTATRTDSVSSVTKGGSMSNIHESRCFDKVLQEYREFPVLWQVRSADYSNRAKRDEAWDLLVQFTREEIPDADLCFVKKRVDSIRASFRKELRRVRDSSIITAAATCFDELIPDTEMYEQSSESAHACVVKYIRARPLSQARRAGLASHTLTCMGSFRPRGHCDRLT